MGHILWPVVYLEAPWALHSSQAGLSLFGLVSMQLRAAAAGEPTVFEGVGAVLMNARQTESETLLTPAEVAAMFRVDPKTVTRWAKAGKLSSIRTLGGHRRYRESEVKALLAGVLPTQRKPEE